MGKGGFSFAKKRKIVAGFTRYGITFGLAY
jgi:hypothetical protein